MSSHNGETICTIAQETRHVKSYVKRVSEDQLFFNIHLADLATYCDRYPQLLKKFCGVRQV